MSKWIESSKSDKTSRIWEGYRGISYDTKAYNELATSGSGQLDVTLWRLNSGGIIISEKWNGLQYACKDGTEYHIVVHISMLYE